MARAQHPWADVEVDEMAAGELVLTTGAIVACDPIVSLGRARPFARTVLPGTYRVVLARRDGDTLYASIVLADAAPTRWIPAHWMDSDSSSYGVDAGTGCFTDAATAAAWSAIETAWDDKTRARITANGVNPADGDAWHAAWRALDAERPDLLTRLREAGYKRRPYASLAIDGAGTLVAFTSGAGDGVYASYWGLDQNDAPVVLLTDFGLVPDEPDDSDEEHESALEPQLVLLATSVLDRLIRDELLVLKKSAKRDRLRDDLADELETLFEEEARGAALGEWLSDRDDIEEVFASDDDLQRALSSPD